MMGRIRVKAGSDISSDPHFAAYGRSRLVNPSWLTRFSKASGNHPVLTGLSSLVLLAGGAVLTEFLIRSFQSLPLLQSVDLRFIYIMVIALLGDGMTGFLAGAIECLLLYRTMHAAGVATFSMLFYNPDNWSTYLLYILLGAGMGYLRSRQRQIQALTEKERDFERRQNFRQRTLYQQLLQKKNEYREDLQNSRTGFGKLYQAFTRLSSVEPARILAEAIPVMEDLLQNTTISIYSIFESNTDSARLQVASREIYNKIPRSIRLSEHPGVKQTLTENNIWFNQDLIPGEPMYIAPIQQDDRLIAMICIRDADFTQTSMYYQNLLFVLSRLIGSLILTAISYQKQIYVQNYMEGTHILRKEVLHKRLDLMNKMKNENISGYRMLKISLDGRSLTEMD